MSMQSKWQSTTIVPVNFNTARINKEQKVNSQLDTVQTELEVLAMVSKEAYDTMIASGVDANTPVGTGLNAGGMVGSRDNPQS